jgi:hypothetical protein
MATHADADLILRLYDLRRESVMRQARSWFAGWLPANADEARLVCTGADRQDNAWLRQACTFWEMAFSIVNEGGIDATLFAKNSGEGVLFAVKCAYLKERHGDAWTRTMPEAEAFIGRHPIAGKRAEAMRKRFP